MKSIRAALLALILLFIPLSALADSCTSPPFPEASSSARLVSGVDLKPLIAFCRIETFHPICSGIDGFQPNASLVISVDRTLREQFSYRTDQANYNVPDMWTSTAICGDCEDYALALARLLAAAGVSGEHMIFITWMPTLYTAHATLLVKTADYGWLEIGVNTSERPEILNWEKGRRYAWMRLDGKRKWIFDGPPT